MSDCAAIFNGIIVGCLPITGADSENGGRIEQKRTGARTVSIKHAAVPEKRSDDFNGARTADGSGRDAGERSGMDDLSAGAILLNR